ncbi:cyclic nucleotide-binding domain-containing protein [Fictibacillus enclensis]|uniref:Crp/Fnr family transcriptional regulator n=1 Tax=Fictibacillus enclensis TaxID=1017270 RepID=UPI0025A12FFD|nr:cyclic nucleotide-binding domain-containing protein [Fictibacillus enclensis]MDM5198278.1 cyclic nucleotide-binding domain-containing protein [Fictibacillus enclensis]
MEELKDTDRITAYLRSNGIESLFNTSLQPHLTLCTFEQGEKICSQGEPAAYLYVLVEGKVKVYTTSPEGKTLILSFKNPLELIGDIEYVRGTETVNTVEAVSQVTMIGVHHRWLKKYGSGDPAFLNFLLEIITNKFYIKSNTLRFNLLYPVEVRLASYLLSVSFDASDGLLNGKHSTASLKDAANLIGTSYRHLNRVIQQLCAEGLVERYSGGILVKDHEGLKKLANDNIYE